MSPLEEQFYCGEPDTPAPNVPLSPGCSAVLFDPLRRILFLKRAGGPWWCLPGGRMEVGESASECCARETLEETGLVVRPARIVAVNSSATMVVSYPDGNVHQSLVICFEAAIIGGALRPSLESSEFRWCGSTDLETMQVIPDSRLNAADAWEGRCAAFIR